MLESGICHHSRCPGVLSRTRWGNRKHSSFAMSIFTATELLEGLCGQDGLRKFESSFCFLSIERCSATNNCGTKSFRLSLPCLGFQCPLFQGLQPNIITVLDGFGCNESRARLWDATFIPQTLDGLLQKRQIHRWFNDQILPDYPLYQSMKGLKHSQSGILYFMR